MRYSLRLRQISRMNLANYVSSHLKGVSVGPTVPSNVDAQTAKIGTHDGSFHCDEAVACGLLRHTTAFQDSVIMRTRDASVLDQCNVVVDVGGKYDVSMMRFDHHQKEFNDNMDTGIKKYKTRLSSAGLVYKHFGKEIIKSFIEEKVKQKMCDAVTESQLMLLYDRIYKGFVEHVDGIDNGVDEFGPASQNDSVVRNYSVSTTLSSRIGRMFPRWNEQQSRAKEDAAFVAAMQLAVTEFFEAADYYLSSWLPARDVVQEAFASSQKVHPSRQIIVFQEGGCPWKEHLLDIEEENGVKGQTLFVIFGDGKGGWRVQCVPKENSSFQNRKSLLWGGLRDEELCKASGIDGCIFVHVTGFIGGNKTFEGAKEMAVKSIAAQ